MWLCEFEAFLKHFLQQHILEEIWRLHAREDSQKRARNASVVYFLRHKLYEESGCAKSIGNTLPLIECRLAMSSYFQRFIGRVFVKPLPL